MDDVQAAQAFFMDTEDGEQLRLILVGDDRVLVFDEPWDNYREYAIEEPWNLRFVTFSRNGRYLAITACKDSTYNDGYFDREIKAYKGFLLEITEDEIISEYFDPSPGGYGYFRYVSNEGRVAGSNERGVISLHPQGDVDGFLARDFGTILWQRRGCSYDNSLIALGNVGNDRGERVVKGFDWSGNQLWDSSIGDRNLTSLRVSPSGKYVLAPARNGGVVCYSGEDGSRLWETAENLLCSFPQISPNGNYWIMAPDEIDHYYFYFGEVDERGNLDNLSIYEFLPGIMHPVCLNVNDLGYSLICSYYPNLELYRTLCLNEDHVLSWSSNLYNLDRDSISFKFIHAQHVDHHFASTIAGISESGNRICYTDYQSIKVLRFEEVQ
ncbi:MAG: hypothetical protein GF388_05360 [Candidatus Aegiribacteria sp.]|nr:hypothetical protein [Candidatus Aegiribacteria sp.]